MSWNFEYTGVDTIRDSIIIILENGAGVLVDMGTLCFWDHPTRVG